VIGWWVVAAGVAALAGSGPHGPIGLRLPSVTRPTVHSGRPVRPRSVGRAPATGDRAVDRAGRGAAARPVVAGRRAARPSERTVPDLATVVTLVAGHLRAGSAPQRAWSDVLAVPVSGRSPTVGELVRPAGTRRPPGRWRDGVVGRVPSEPASAVVAACQVADELGAPLAAVLDEIAGALAADAEARADLVAALAGPRSGARVVGWLPVLGALLGAVLGADPFGVLLGGGWPSAAGLLGAGLLLVGHLWTRWLVARAGRAGR
jgi:tight adherence protein B